jgi:ribonuclease HI
MTTEKEIPAANAAVFYTDGSAKPNPGVATYGVHGYSYIINGQKPPTFKYDFSTLGYLKKENVQEEATVQENNDTEEDGFESTIDDKNYSLKTPGKILGQTAQENNVLTKQSLPAYPIEVFDIYGYVGENLNNNIAELEAAKSAIECSVKNGYKNIDIITDSINTVQCFNSWIYKWADNNWKKSDGAPLKSLEYMQDLYKYLNDVTSQGYTYNLHWIEGHCGHYGNERADMNAEHAHNNKETIFIKRDSQSHFGMKSKRPSQLFLPSLIGILEDKRSDGKYLYISTNREEKIQLYGTKSTSAAYSILITKTPIKEIEFLYTGCRSFGVDTAKYVLVDLQKLYSKNAVLDIEDLKEKAFIKNDAKSFIVGTAHCYDIAVQLDTPIMTHSVIKICNDTTNMVLDCFNKNTQQDNIKCYEITDQIFVKNQKGKTEVVKNFNHTDKVFSFEFDLFGEKTKEEFVPGQCFPSRSVYKELEGKTCKQYLIVKENKPVQSWSYAFYMITDDFEIITIPGYATTRIKLTQEQKSKIVAKRMKDKK